MNPVPVSIKWKGISLETVVQRCSAEKVFLKISKKSQENACARASFLIKLHASSNFV